MDGAPKRDAVVFILFCTALLVVILNFTAAMLFAASGMSFLWMVKTAMWLTGLFAIVGAAFAVVRGVGRQRAKTQRKA